ncbi:hypothetical protein C8Q70DRAFT_1081102 [Cubamyces menziesii]|nr:hypothetical protein C8Q70DRAFT_1081102 [Cubamyces menziesii]
MSPRRFCSASIPIPLSSTARTSARTRLVSTAGTGSSLSPARLPLPLARSVSTSYSSALNSIPRGRPAGPTQINTTPVFEPRISRATTSPTPSRDPACNAPYASATSPVRPRRLSAGVRSQSVVSSSSLSQRTTASTAHAAHTPPLGFSRPDYLDYSSLRDMLHTEPAPSVLVPAARPTPYAVSAQDVRSSVSPAPPSIPYPYFRRDLSPVGDSDDESVATPPPPPPAVGAVTVLSTNTVLMLPTRWSDQDRMPSLSVSSDGRDLTFTGPSCVGDRESSAARANHPIPPACGIYYYEVEILHKCPKGFSAPDVRLSPFPGHKDGSPFGPTFDTGDVIGCGIDFSQNRVFYTKNGTFLGLVFENVGKTTEVYPCIGMRQTNESIHANFGNAPFRFAIEEHVRAQRDKVWNDIMGTRVDWGLLGLGPRKSEEQLKAEEAKAKAAGGDAMEDEESKAPLRKLVLAYLAHHGYARTARAFQKQCAERSRAAAGKEALQSKSQPADEDAAMAVDTDDTSTAGAASTSATSGSSAATEDLLDYNSEYGLDRDLNTKLSITNAIIRGNIDTALSLIRANHPSVLEREQGLILFRLRCRKFVKLDLQAGAALRKVREAEFEASLARPKEAGVADKALDGVGDGVVGEMDGVGAMDVDDPSPEAHHTPSMSTPTASAPTAAQNTYAMLSAMAKDALHTALSYGQQLETDYKNDTRPGVRAHLRRSFGIVVYEEPIAAGGAAAKTAGRQSLLQSRDRPAHPTLETLYCQTNTCLTGSGMAAQELTNIVNILYSDYSRDRPSR